ncbi:hypothetical protein BCR32DRAFT_326680 [Anaeromyces robustus]|uniref:Uncharacterized protein n=1 Tax=Anaeromyces robustus TaxID=1754192 RepID=A0A1Y1XAU3_9FUNG|nr:hypothetical protein BCR32DRAFT_326680 [Anaeromyces robustus]|eukprot:ORX82833.1 hypothetical protein BCR32DRAFT_326680 [Anaeromyces robustus]
MDLDYCPSEPESDDNVDEIEKCSESMPLSDELTYLLTDATLGLKDQNLTIDQVLKGVEDAPVYRRTRKNLSLEKFNMDSLDGMLSASLASNVNKLNIDKESVEYRRFCMDITHGTKNISDDDDGEYNEQSKNQTNDIDYTKSVSVEELDDLFQDFIQDPNEINRNTAELKNDITTPNWVIDEKHLFSQEQIELLKKQMLQNFQIVTQAYAIEKELRGPDSIQAGHWKSQLMEMDQCICWSDTQKEEAMINSEKYIEKEKEKDEINENKNGKGKESEVDKDTLSKVNIKCEGALSIKQSYFEIPGFDRLSRLFEIPYDNSSTKSRQFSRNFSRQYSKSEVIKYRTADDIDKRVKFKSIVPVQLPESIEQMIEIYSDVFDPNLIPDILRVRRGRMRFLPIEDELLLAGLKRFGDDDWFSIRAYYLPTKTRKQLKTRYKNLISRRTPESPVKDWYLEQFKPLIYLEREVIQSCTQLYGKSFKVIIRDLFPHQPEFLLKRTWEELYTYGEVGYSWEFSKGEIKKSKQEILLIGKQLKLYYKQCDEKSSDNKKIRITNPCVYRLNDGNSVVFGSNADLKELDDQMAKARLQRGLPIDYDSFKVKSVRGNRLVLGNDKAVWVLPNQYIKSSNKNVNTKKQKRKLDTLKSELSRIKPSKLLKLNNNKLPISSISNSTNSSSILIDNSVITTNKRINNITTTIPKNIYFKSKNTHSSIQPKITNKNDSIPKVSVVLTSSPMKNSLMSSKINRHIKNPNQKIVKIYNHTGSRNGLKGSKIQADLSTVTMNKDNEALFAPLIENVCDQVASRVMDSIIAKMINKSIDILVDDKEMNNYLNSSLSNTTSNSSSTTMYNHISSLTNRILHHHH